MFALWDKLAIQGKKSELWDVNLQLSYEVRNVGCKLTIQKNAAILTFFLTIVTISHSILSYSYKLWIVENKFAFASYKDKLTIVRKMLQFFFS